MSRILLAFACAAGLGGCVNQAQIVGRTSAGDEVFSGGSLRGVSGGGVLVVTSNRGRTCRGRFVYDAPRSGKGTFVCSDGRSGPFDFVSDGFSGTGTGEIGGRRFTFVFG